MRSVFVLISLVYGLSAGAPPPQASGSSGTVVIAVNDPSGAAVAGATVTIANKMTGYEKSTVTDNSGSAQFTNIPFHRYHLQVTAGGFQSAVQDVELRSGVPVTAKFNLAIATSTTSVEVHSEGSDIVESVPMAHTDVDENLFNKLPETGTGQGVTDVLRMAVPDVVGDSDGLIHPAGDHAETQYAIDNQPIGNQQNKQASNQLPLNAIQSFEAITGAPPPEYGDKASLVVTTTTKSGMGTTQPFGSFSANYGSFGTYGEDFTFGIGNNRIGNFIVADTERSGRYLDSPEFSPLHDVGNNERIFDRLDFQADQNDTLHLDLFAGRSWFQIPNTYDQQDSGQDQRQQVRTYNIALGWVHLLGPTMIININPFFRQDIVQYYPSGNVYDDLPATVAQDRRLGNLGVKADLSYVHGIHNAKIGVQVTDNIITEHFSLGITDPTFNAPCLNSAGLPLPGLCNSNNGSVTTPNPSFIPGLLPYDLTRGGQPFVFSGHAAIKEYGFYLQDSITLGNFTAMAGLRGDMYYGLVSDSSVEPRLGGSYLLKKTNTVFRISYSKFFETPYNENLLVSNATGSGGLANTFGAFGQQPLKPGTRNQYQVGLQQGLGKHITIDANYFWKYTDRAYDFDNLFNTPIAFPIEWRKSKIDGVGVRVNFANYKGFTAYSVMGHTRARFFGPEVGGLLFNSPLDSGVFRIDHDEAFEQTTSLHYQPKKNGWWGAFTWDFDSGLVAGSVPDLASALALTADEQQEIGFYCGNDYASLTNHITSCNSPVFGATRLTIPAPGTFNPDHNPPRIAPHNQFDLGVGNDNLFKTDKLRWTLQLTAVNITNTEALYNFLSTFSGTHFVSPRAYRAEFGFVF